MDLRPLIQDNGSKIILFVWDGLGGLPYGAAGKTELETARTPNADRLVAEGTCGLFEPVYPGVTPGSGPGHLGLFGTIRWSIRSAAGRSRPWASASISVTAT